MKNKRIYKITRFYNLICGKQYKMELEQNYHFDNSGSDTFIGDSIFDIYNATIHIVFCDGN